MESDKLIQIIADNFLVVRRLPFEVVSYYTYREGDELKKYHNEKGDPIKSVREIVVQNYDLEYFRNTPPPKYSNQTPEQRLAQWNKIFPEGRKLLKETKTVKNGGWWYVKQVENTDSTVRFDRKIDKFFAPTLEEAVLLFLSKHE